MKVQIFYTSVDYDFVSFAIRRASGGKWSHTGILFTIEKSEWEELNLGLTMHDQLSLPADMDGRHRIYFESISTTDIRTNKTGCRGPYAFNKLSEWADSRLSNHLEIQDIPMNTLQAHTMFYFCMQAVPRVKYAHIQILQNWFGYRFGKGVPLRRRSANKWTCVEFDVRAVAEANPGFCVEYLQLGEVLFDEYCPSGTNGPGLFEMIAAANR